MKHDTPSFTSLLVAYGVLVLGGDAYGRARLPLNCLDAQIRFIQAAQLPFYNYLWLIHNPIVAKLCRWSMRIVTHPFNVMGIGDRKCFMEDQVCQAIRGHAVAGSHRAKQVLIVAAGYDMMPYRLSLEYPDVQFYEVDHPATSTVKQFGLKQMDPRPNLHIIEADLTIQKLTDVLAQQASYNVKKSTVVVMEGLLYYLAESNVRELFHQVAKSVGPDSIVAFDFFRWNKQQSYPYVAGRANSIIQWIHRVHGEPFLWAIDPLMLDSFFVTTPWRVDIPVKASGVELMTRVRLHIDQ